MNHWNELIRIRDSHKDADVRKMAEMLLDQWNTAAGSILMKSEVENFIEKHGGP